MKKRAKKLLRELLAATEGPGQSLLDRVNGDTATSEALVYLEAKELVTVRRAFGGAVYDIRLLPLGVTFFQDTADRRRERWLDRAAGFVCGVLSTVAAQLIIQAIHTAIAR